MHVGERRPSRHDRENCCECCECMPENCFNAERVAQLEAALEHEQWCRPCAEDGCASCPDCTAPALLATRTGETK